MPKIKGLDLPPQILTLLFERAKERKITLEDFGSFKLFGEGQYPKTFPLKGPPAHGREVE